MIVLVAAIVVYGFGQTIDKNLIHAKPSRPGILVLHSILFSSWIVLLLVQSTLVQVHQVKVHRLIGFAGTAYGVLLPGVGLATSIVMDRFDYSQDHDPADAPFFAIQLVDLLAFTVLFWLAILWRKNRESHRRLILLATFCLTGAAFSRFPQIHSVAPTYLGIDGLVLIGIFHDWLTLRRIHPAYLWTLAGLALIQPFEVWFGTGHSAVWNAFTGGFLR